MAVVFRAQVSERRGPPIESIPSWREPRLNVNVIFTSLKGTRAALQAAGKLARDLGARVTVLAAQVVPYPLPLEKPPVPVEFTEQALLQVVSEEDVETAIDLRLCRDSEETIREALPPGSVVVIGDRRRWWRVREWMLAWKLRRDGHRVIYAGNSDNL